MSAIELPKSAQAAVMAEARKAADERAAAAPRAARHARPTKRVAPRPASRTRNRWIGIAACFVLAAGIGAFALTAGPLALQQPNDAQKESTGGNLVSSDSLPAGNFFTLTAYADEADQPAATGTTIELDASGFRLVSYNNAWVDPETGEQADWREFAGMKAGINAGIVGNNVETVTYSIEGEDAYLEAIVDDPPTQEQIDAYEAGKIDTLYTTSQQRATSFTLDYDDVALGDGTTFSDVNTILSIYLKVPVPNDTLTNWDTASSISNSVGYSTAEGFDAIRSASTNASKSLDIAGSDVLATCKLTLTATFADGSTQTKTYAIGTVPDYQQRIADYWDAVNESGRDYEWARANDEEPSEEAIAKAEARPDEPALYTLTEIA